MNCRVAAKEIASKRGQNHHSGKDLCSVSEVDRRPCKSVYPWHPGFETATAATRISWYAGKEHSFYMVLAGNVEMDGAGLNCGIDTWRAYMEYVSQSKGKV